MIADILGSLCRAGCDSYGIEINAPVAALSFKQETEFYARLRMWGLTAGPVVLREGSFIESDEAPVWIRKADVVLVNNYIFSSERESTPISSSKKQLLRFICDTNSSDTDIRSYQ